MECLPSRRAKNRTRSCCLTILLVSFMMQLPCRVEVTPDGCASVAHNLPNEVHAKCARTVRLTDARTFLDAHPLSVKG